MSGLEGRGERKWRWGTGWRMFCGGPSKVLGMWALEWGVNVGGGLWSFREGCQSFKT